MGRIIRATATEPLFPKRIPMYDSKVGLDNIWLRRLEKAANLRESVSESLQEWVNAQAEALFTRWVIEQRQPGRNLDPNLPLSGNGNGRRASAKH